MFTFLNVLCLSEITQVREAGDARADNIKVSVRVRPVNSRERGLKSQVVTSVDVESATISLKAPGSEGGSSSNSSKLNRFTFDHVFDSHDADATGHLHATQRTVFEDIGLEICESAQVRKGRMGERPGGSAGGRVRGGSVGKRRPKDGWGACIDC